jgi:hypothetical protein
LLPVDGDRLLVGHCGLAPLPPVPFIAVDEPPTPPGSAQSASLPLVDGEVLLPDIEDPAVPGDVLGDEYVPVPDVVPPIEPLPELCAMAAPAVMARTDTAVKTSFLIRRLLGLSWRVIARSCANRRNRAAFQPQPRVEIISPNERNRGPSVASQTTSRCSGRAARPPR